MSSNEDEIPQKDPYSWVKKNDEAEHPLDEFLKKYRPSMVQNDGTKPWLWVTREMGPRTKDDFMDMLAEAQELLDATTKRVEEIQNDASIPLRSSKKTGAKSKKEVREQVQTEAAEKLKDISITREHTTGKWLMFAGSDRVDTIWANLAKSLISGPLSSTEAFCVKVSTSPKEETSNYQHVICLYMPNVYDKDSVTKVMKVLLRNHGMNLSGVKSDLYTYIGIKSKHPSGIQSTVFKPTDLMKDSEIKALKDAFFEDLKKPSVAPVATEGGDDKETKKPTAKPKQKLKKNQKEDPFGSGSEDNEDAPVEQKPSARRDSDEEDAKQEKNAKRKAPTRKRARSESDSEDDKRAKPKRATRK